MISISDINKSFKTLKVNKAGEHQNDNFQEEPNYSACVLANIQTLDK